MSQNTELEEQQIDEQSVPEEEEYDSALDEALEDNEDNSEGDGDQGQEQPSEEQKDQSEQIAPTLEQASVPQSVPPAPAAQDPVVQSPSVVPQGQQQDTRQVKPKVVEINDDIKEEWERLKKISPDAAALVQEDSPEGQRLRERLGEYGASYAYDESARILEGRNNAVRMQQERQRRLNQQIVDHNNYFMSRMNQLHPEHMQLLRDPNRKSEAQARVRDIFQWIESLPYSEAKNLMPIAQSGRDPEQVGALLTRYYQARGKGSVTSKRKDPTGAMAVPGRGGTVAPVGVGDKDDFDAALDAGLSSER